MKNVFYKYDYYGTNDSRELGHRFKENDLVSVQRVAHDIATIIDKDCNLVPIPNKYDYAHQNLSLANLIMIFNPGVKVFDIMKGAERDSLYDAKKSGQPLNENELAFYLTGPIPKGKRIYLVDNIIGTGLTAASALKLIPSADVLVHSVDRKTFDRSPYRNQFTGVYLCDGNLQTIYDIADKVMSIKIELKKVEIYERMSEETTAFVADLYINNFKAGLARNDGRGGITFCQVYNAEGQDLIRMAEMYCKTLPPTVYPPFHPGDEPFTVPMTLDRYVDDLLSKFRFEKNMKDGILYGKSQDQYSILKLNYSIEAMLKDPNGVRSLKEAIKRVIGQLEEGHRILNTNLPENMMQVASNQAQKSDLKNTSLEKKRTSPGQKNRTTATKRKPKK